MMGPGGEQFTDTRADITSRCRRTIIIPAYNEEQRIRPTLRDFLAYYDDEDTEVMVVLNGCRDSTRDIVSAFLSEHPNLRVVEEVNPIGKGGALMLGFRLARGDIIAYVDADGATSPENLERLMESLGQFDCVIGSRWLDKSLVLVRQSLLRRISSRVFNLIVRILFRMPFRDTLCGAKAFKREAIESIQDKLGTTNVAFDVDVLYLLQKDGFTIKEMPLEWADRPGSKFKIRKDAPLALGALIRMRIKHSRLRNIVK